MRLAFRLSLLALSFPVVASFLPLLAHCQSSSCSAGTYSSLQQSSSDSASTIPTMKFFQKEITITAPSRGCHLITNDVTKAVGSDLSQIKIGLCNLFIQHTSASLTINENADPDVRRDMEMALNKIGE